MFSEFWVSSLHYSDLSFTHSFSGFWTIALLGDSSFFLLCVNPPNFNLFFSSNFEFRSLVCNCEFRAIFLKSLSSIALLENWVQGPCSCCFNPISLLLGSQVCSPCACGIHLPPVDLGVLSFLPIISVFQILCPCVWVSISITLFLVVWGLYPYTWNFKFLYIFIGILSSIHNFKGLELHPFFLRFQVLFPSCAFYFHPLFPEVWIPSPCFCDCSIFPHALGVSWFIPFLFFPRFFSRF